MLPGLIRTAATPASIARSARLALKWMSAITGIGENRTILGSASASSVFGTATRTISQPAEASAAICAVVVEERLKSYPQHIEVAVLGCAVNGPGEAGDADFGIAGGRDVGFIYAHGRVLKKVSSDILIDELFYEIDRWIEDGMHRPKRLKMAKPAALAMAEMSEIPLESPVPVES